MDSVKSMGNRTGSHTVDPASLRGQLGGVQTLPAVMGSTLAERARRELGKVVTKLAISSRRPLHRVLSVDPDTLLRR